MWKNGDQLYVQLPPCSTKDGVVTPKRNHYIDLIYDKPFPEETMEWVEQIEVFVRKMIYSKRESHGIRTFLIEENVDLIVADALSIQDFVKPITFALEDLAMNKQDSDSL